MMDAAALRFLYRQAEGRIGPAEWRRASVPTIGLAAALTLVAVLLAPGPRDLTSQPFFSLSIVVVHAYFIIYGFALILLAIAQYFVSAKRFADLGRSPALAGLAPFVVFLACAVVWYQPRSEGTLPAWGLYPFLVAALAVVLWNVWVLGFVMGRAD